MGYGLIDGIPNLERDLKQIRNGNEEDVILRQCPFHTAPTPSAALMQYTNAVRLVFETVPEQQLHAVMGRLNRKLVARMKFFKNKR